MCSINLSSPSRVDQFDYLNIFRFGDGRVVDMGGDKVVSWQNQKCPKDGESVRAFIVAGGHGEPIIYPKKCFYDGRGKCPKDKRKKICKFELPEEMK